MRTVFALALVALLGTAHAQTVLFQDDFSDNTNGWRATDESYASANSLSCSVVDGAFGASNGRARGNWSIVNSQVSIDFNENTNWTLAAKIGCDARGEEANFGVLWGAVDENNHQVFRIYKNGAFSWEKISQGKRTRGHEGTSDTIKSDADSYSLAIVRQGYRVSFYVDGVMIHDDESIWHSGSHIGFWVGPQTSITVDRITISARDADAQLSHPVPTPDSLFCQRLEQINGAMDQDFHNIKGVFVEKTAEGDSVYECKVAMPGAIYSEIAKSQNAWGCEVFFYDGDSESNAGAIYTGIAADLKRCLADWGLNESTQSEPGVLREIIFKQYDDDYNYIVSLSLQQSASNYGVSMYAARLKR